MTDLSNQAAPPNGGQPPTPRPRGRGWLFITTIALAAAFTGALTTRALTHGFGPGYWHGRAFMGGPLTAGEIEDRADRGIRHLAVELDATPDQQEKLRSIAKDAVKDLLPMREKARAARERAAALLTSPTVDRAAIEAFRAEQLALADAASKRFAQALADVAEVLTPEQRRKVGEHLQARKAYWRGWHRG